MKLESGLFNMAGRRKSYAELISDSIAIGLFAGLSTLGNTLPTSETLFIAVKAFALAAVAQYIFEKKIKKHES